MPRLCLYICQAMALATSAGCSAEGQDESLRPPQLDSRRLKVVGRELRDGLDRQVLLRGFSAGGRAKMPPFIPFEVSAGDFAKQTDSYFAAHRALGANMVRLVLSWEALESVKGMYDALYWKRFRAMLDAAHARGLSVIVDFHQDVFASPFCGDGFPLWALGNMTYGKPRYDCDRLKWGQQYFDPTGPVGKAFDRLWNNTDGLQDRLEAMWKHVASQLRSHPAVAAFEVINEPGAGSIGEKTFSSKTLPQLYARVGRAIQAAAGAKVPVLGGGPAGDPQALAGHLERPNLDAFVYAPHYYDTAMFVGMPMFSESVVRDGLTRAFAHASKWGVPGILGEFGAPNDNAKKGDYVGFVLDVMDSLYLGAVIWDGSISKRLWNNEDFSAFHADGRARGWADAMIRGYPRAVAGKVTRFVWSKANRTLRLEVNPARAGITEVYWPARRLGKQPEVSVQGASWNWIADQELLLVSAKQGAAVVVDLGPPGSGS